MNTFFSPCLLISTEHVQILSGILAVICIVIIIMRRKKKKKAEDDDF